MVENGVVPNKYTYPFALKACSGLRDVGVGKRIHERVRTEGMDGDVYVCTALVDFYVKCGLLGDARMVFDKMGSRDVVAWNAMIAGCSLHGMWSEAMALVKEMQEVGLRMNSSSVVAILPAIGEGKELMRGKEVHGFCLRRRYDGDVAVGTGFLDMYAKCGFLDYTRKVFDSISVKNEVTWSAMISACVACGSNMEALKLFDEIMVKNDAIISPIILAIVLRACANLTDVNKGRLIHGYSIKLGFVSYLIIGNTLVSFYTKCGKSTDAVRFVNEMDAKDTVSFNSVISGCVQNGDAGVAFNMFYNMRSLGITPDIETMIGFFPACSHLAALQHGTCGHGYSILQGFTESTKVCNAIIDMYSKCGNIIMARSVFDQMWKKDLISWNAMILGYGIHGLGLGAVSLFKDMLTVGLNPDDVTFICLLSACSHSSLVAEGKHWYAAMTENFHIKPRTEHYWCMVDLLGRAGLVSEAHGFILRMPIKPHVRIWSALLGACRIHKHVELGEEVSRNIQILGAESTGNFVLLSNIYSAAKRWDDAARTRVLQREKGFKKIPGCSWVEINGIVHTFVGGEKSHPQWPLINKRLDELLVAMKKLGYGGDYSFVLQDVEEEEMEHILLYHSEKLAVALGDLSLGPGKTILVTKNLRVGDFDEKFGSIVVQSALGQSLAAAQIANGKIHD
nr:pentatricopeptide repeat-containing protein At3g16610 [Tanacetum cinerariifolium]